MGGEDHGNLWGYLSLLLLLGEEALTLFMNNWKSLMDFQQDTGKSEVMIYAFYE